ncbi:uncharacterized protein J3D65DRAFT_151832 [Phyllosticta citribraziliensis]|uniref:Uncharacterized protein n=1 Tax=Phyllosticta citribraziliensis TaxID=989973 RepID=A0ABR1L4W7_9PEZI
MSIFSKLRAKSFKASKQKQKEPTATAEKQTPELEKENDAQPQPQSGAIPTVAVQEVPQDDPQAQPESKRASWRPVMNRTKSNESLKRLSAPVLRNSTSAPNLRTLKHRSSDLSIESVMLSLDFPMPASSTAKQPADTMTLKTRNSLVAPNQFTYDPSKTPAFVGRKKGRPRRLHPSSRASSFIRLQQIEPMAEENEDGETVDSSSTSTKSGSSGSSARSQYLEKKRSVQSSASTLSDTTGSSSPSSSSPSRRASWANSDRSGSSAGSSVSDVTIPPPICEGVAVAIPVVHVSVAFADPPVTTTIPPPPATYDDDEDDAGPVISVMEDDDSPPASPKCSTNAASLSTRSTFSLRKKRSWFRKKHDSGTITIF